MTAHIRDDLSDLLLGQADRNMSALAIAHVQECADCCDDLMDFLTAHAALMATASGTFSADCRVLNIQLNS